MGVGRGTDRRDSSMGAPGAVSCPDLLLVEGGPTYLIQQRLKLLRRDSPRIVRRSLLSISVTWLPLLILTLWQGVAFGDAVQIPFLRDIGTYSRYLVALPLLIAAEVVVGRSVLEAGRQFGESGITTVPDYPAYTSAVGRALRLRDSNLAEAVVLAVAYLSTYFGTHVAVRLVFSWQRADPGSSQALSWAGYWNLLISLPLFLFLLYRWLWRLTIWYSFLYRMNRLNLRLTPTHPDRAGGIGFLNEAQTPFAMVVFALGATSAGVLANAILAGQETPRAAGLEITGLLVVILVVFVLPLLMFTPRLIQLRRQGLKQYGRLSTQYTQSFHRKWIGGENLEGESVLGTSDIQSLADLGNSFNMVDRGSPVPFNSRLLVAMAAACVMPMLPVILTFVSMKDVLLFLGRLVFG